MTLKVLAITIGLIIIITRIPGYQNPEKMRVFLKKLISSELWLKLASLIFVFIGAAFLMLGLSHDVFLREIAVLLGLLWLLIGIILLLKPFILVNRFISKVITASDQKIRMICLVTGMIGFLILALGLFAY